MWGIPHLNKVCNQHKKVFTYKVLGGHNGGTTGLYQE